MNGTSHTIIGAATGFIVANYVQADPKDTIMLVSLGGISGLVADLEIGEKLRNKLTMPQTYIRKIAQFIGILFIIYSYFITSDTYPYIGVGIGVAIFLLASMFKQRHMLIITSIGVGAG